MKHNLHNCAVQKVFFQLLLFVPLLLPLGLHRCGSSRDSSPGFSLAFPREKASLYFAIETLQLHFVLCLLSSLRRSWCSYTHAYYTALHFSTLHLSFPSSSPLPNLLLRWVFVTVLHFPLQTLSRMMTTHLPYSSLQQSVTSAVALLSVPPAVVPAVTPCKMKYFSPLEKGET